MSKDELIDFILRNGSSVLLEHFPWCESYNTIKKYYRKSQLEMIYANVNFQLCKKYDDKRLSMKHEDKSYNEILKEYFKNA